MIKELAAYGGKRIGAAIATILVTYGLAVESADIVVNSLGAIGAVAVEFALVKMWSRKRA